MNQADSSVIAENVLHVSDVIETDLSPEKFTWCKWCYWTRSKWWKCSFIKLCKWTRWS